MREGNDPAGQGAEDAVRSSSAVASWRRRSIMKTDDLTNRKAVQSFPH